MDEKLKVKKLTEKIKRLKKEINILKEDAEIKRNKNYDDWLNGRQWTDP